MAKPRLGARDALLVVDVQNDFCSGGALAVPGGDEVVPVLNEWIAAAVSAGAAVFATRCWHPPGHASFLERGGPWPPHCIQGTRGAQFHPDLALPEGVPLVTKGADPDRDDYSDFAGTGLADRLRGLGVRRIFIGGLALDYCVRASALEGLALGFDVHVIGDATRAVDVRQGDGARALGELRAAGAVVEERS